MGTQTTLRSAKGNSIYQRAMDSVSSAAEPAKQWLTESVDTLKEKQALATRGMTTYVQNKPLTVVAIALGAGLLVGTLLKSRRRSYSSQYERDE